MKFLRLSLCLLSATLFLGSCIKKTYDTPLDTSQYDPKLATNATLKNISDLGLALPSGKSRIMGDTTVWGVVVADDRSGNYYKQIVIEDASGGGILLYIDKSYLYADYPAGRKIYVNLKGLTLDNYNGLPEIVYSADATGYTTAIPSGLIGNYITKAIYPDNSVQANNVTIEQVKSNPILYLNTLIKISNVQFATGSYGVSYAAPSASASATNRILENCDHSATATVRTSGYSNFQPYIIPAGNGSLTGICSVYGSTLQITVRDTTDVSMTTPRCP